MATTCYGRVFPLDIKLSNLLANTIGSTKGGESSWREILKIDPNVWAMRGWAATKTMKLSAGDHRIGKSMF